MKIVAVVLLGGGYLLGIGSAFANTADDISWIARCMTDNKSEKGVSIDIAFKYCKCMNNKMSDNETKSITAWEKTHPDEMKACDTEAGWR